MQIEQLLDAEVTRLFKNHRFEGGFLKHVAFIGQHNSRKTALISALAPDPYYTRYSEMCRGYVSVVAGKNYCGWIFLWDLPSFGTEETTDAVLQRYNLLEFHAIVIVIGNCLPRVCVEISKIIAECRPTECIFVRNKSDVDLRNLCDNGKINLEQAKIQLKEEIRKEFKQQLQQLACSERPPNVFGPFLVTPNYWKIHKLYKKFEIDEREFSEMIFSKT